MGDVPVLPPPPPTRGDRLSTGLTQVTAQLHELLSLTLTGERHGTLRRPVLFLLVALALGTTPWTVTIVVGLLAVMLLALTDRMPVE